MLTSREELGAASGTKRATSCVLISYVSRYYIKQGTC